MVQSAGQDRDAAAARAVCAAVIRQHTAPFGRYLQLCDVPDCPTGPGSQSSCTEECRNTVPLLATRLSLDVLLPDDTAFRFQPVQAQATVVYIGQHLQVPGANL